MNMKFVKGMMFGGLISAGIYTMCKESNMNTMNKKKMIKKGRQWIKKMGII